MTEKESFVGVRIRKSLLEAMDKAIEKDTCSNRSEFIKHIIRNELRRRGFTWKNGKLVLPEEEEKGGDEE